MLYANAAKSQQRCIQRLQTRGIKILKVPVMKDPMKTTWPVPAFYPNERNWVPSEKSERSLIVKNIQYHFKNSDIKEAFSPCGAIEKIIRPREFKTGKLRRYCVVRFENKESVDEAMKMDRPVIDDFELMRKPSAGEAMKIPPVNRRLGPRPPFCKVIYVSKLNQKKVTSDELIDFFEEHVGSVKNAVVLRQVYTGKSRGDGFVEFVNSKSVMKALELGGHELFGRGLEIGYAKKFPHHLLAELKIKDDADVHPGVQSDYYVGTRHHMGTGDWQGIEPFWKTEGSTQFRKRQAGHWFYKGKRHMRYLG